MNKDELIKYINQGLSTWKLAKQLNTTQPNIRYWLKKYNLKTNVSNNKIDNTKTCPRCTLTKARTEFYISTKSSSYCKQCILESNTERRIIVKQQCVDYLGGCCTECGYNKSLAALDFHHLNPLEKDMKYLNHRMSFEKLKVELDKCVLLCANCHREKHHSS
jgi:hypothetical protein